MKWLELRVPPPLILLVSMALAWLIDRFLPQARFDFPGRVAVSIAVAVLGIAVSVSGVREFRRVRTTVNPLRPQEATALVDSGIFARTRNPMYLGLMLVLTGFGLWRGNVAALLLSVLACAAYLTRFQILPEEGVLAEKFGMAFRAYTRRVRRWI